MAAEALFAGCMSGTSLDGIDLVVADFAGRIPKLLAATTVPMPAALRSDLLNLCRPGRDSLDLLGSADVQLARTIAGGLRDLLDDSDIAADRIQALGSHGQTVRHRPDTDAPFTLQIGDPSLIAELTGISVVADFRRRDMAAGGQGAPLVPAFHAAVFQTAFDRVVVNIGGMANVSVLPGGDAERVTGFDTGPGNALLDAWAERHLGRPFDADGGWGRQAEVDPALLATLLSDPYFAREAPKSTGREHFDLEWLDARVPASTHPATVQATLTELTARSIAHGIIGTAGMRPKDVLVCGGGRHNGLLMARLAAALPQVRVTTTDTAGLDGDWVEGLAFAWLARQRLTLQPGNLPAVTGACGPRILGAIYPA